MSHSKRRPSVRLWRYAAAEPAGPKCQEGWGGGPARPIISTFAAPRKPFWIDRRFQGKRPNLIDEVVAEAMRRRFLDEGKPRTFVKSAGSAQGGDRPQVDTLIAKRARLMHVSTSRCPTPIPRASGST